MQKRKIFFIGLIFIIHQVGLAAQLQGRVEDREGQPVPFATIALLSSDSILLTGTITDDSGNFIVNQPSEASILKASCIGYHTCYYNINGQMNHLLIRMEATVKQMAEVVVKARTPLVERQMDKIVMNVAASPFAVGNNGKDILKKAPGVHIDRKGKVTVNGKEVEVYIDGRPSYLKGEQLKTMLEGTDGATIDQLEIITQPSAKYDAAGQGGIINIKTKRNRSKGVNGSLSFGYGGMYWRNLRQYMQDDHLSFNFNYRGAKTYTSLALTQQYNDRTESYQSLTASPADKRQSYSQIRNRHQYYMLKLSNDFMIDTANTIGFIVSVPVSLGHTHGDKEHNYSTYYIGDALSEQNSEALKTDNRWLQHAANLNYTHVFSSALDQELTINIDYNRNNNRIMTHSYNEYMPVSANLYALNIEQNTRHLTNIYSARADFQTQFWQTGKIECGFKWLTTQTEFHSATDTIDAGLLLSDFNYKEHVAALYATIGKQFGEHWSTKIGLRGEYTRSIGQWLTADKVSGKSYFNLFPTVYIGYMPSDDWSVSIDYCRRIDRPHYTMLDPSWQYEDGHSFRAGNTELMPAFTHNVLVSFGYSEYISLDFEFSHTRNLTDYQILFLSGGNRLSQAVNYGTSTMHGIFLSLTEIPLVPKLTTDNENGRRKLNGAWLALTLQAGAGHEIIKSYDGTINMKQWMLDLSAELNAYLPKDWTISLDGMYSTPSVWGMEKLSSWQEMNLAVKKDFPRIGLTLTMRVSDLLLSTQWHSTSVGLPDGYTNTFTGNDRMHSLSFGLNYKFGTIFEHRQHTDLEDNRTSESTGKKHRR